MIFSFVTFFLLCFENIYPKQNVRTAESSKLVSYHLFFCLFHKGLTIYYQLYQCLRLS